MLSPVMKNKNKKGLSLIVGYMLLITVSIAVSVIVYQWLKTYVPKEGLACEDGTSFFIKEYTCQSGVLTLTFKNNGRFSIDGYFIRGSNSLDTLAAIDLSSKFMGSATEKAEQISGNSIRFNSLANYLSPESPLNVQTDSFDISTIGTLAKLEIIPIRIQTEENVKRIISCTDAKIENVIVCS